ncbi:hypothetical protein [Hyphomonas sp.]|jgi:hypothetical protein|uniref:gp33 family protein n=1 Tax=Hyphomonas sp. TaxID=87 RepID=UPI000C8BF0F4|nr:hypothetical protein [Hyphomonas sp.]MAL42686.1 hypothetical protein [Hyphomonas sp.]|tara:strand:+ start:299 stop:877 length:579 start_codon:yes stop_codon:yes gene_type:complete
MEDIFAEIEADAATASGVEKLGEDKLSSVSQIAEKMRLQEELVEGLNQSLKDAKQTLYKLRDDILPTALQELGLTGLSLADGSKVTVKPVYGGHISEANKKQAHQWLRDNGFGDIIKNTVSCQFGRGEDYKAEMFRRHLEEQGMEPSQKTEVHAQTLKAWVRERVEDGKTDFPMDLFGAYVGQQAKIERSKK